MTNPIEKWEEMFDKNFHVGNLSGCIKESPITIKNFIRNLLTENEKRVRGEIIEVIKGNYKGSFTDNAGYDCWYIDDLVSLLDSTKELDNSN